MILPVGKEPRGHQTPLQHCGSPCSYFAPRESKGSTTGNSVVTKKEGEAFNNQWSVFDRPSSFLQSLHSNLKSRICSNARPMLLSQSAERTNLSPDLPNLGKYPQMEFETLKMGLPYLGRSTQSQPHPLLLFAPDHPHPPESTFGKIWELSEVALLPGAWSQAKLLTGGIGETTWKLGNPAILQLRGGRQG